jgi:endonuclease/exonuclease/phosphatase family metal-dependent hydrolase
MPYSGSAAKIPGTIQAEHFDNGGQNTAYYDRTAGNTGGVLRSTDVDLEWSVEYQTNVGWISAGEWLRYSVNVTAAGTYNVTFRVASLGQGGTFHLEMNGVNVTGSLTVPKTGGWQSWTSVTKSVKLSAGQQSARVVFDTAGSGGAVGNFNWMKFEAVSSASSPSSGGPTPYRGSPIALPGTVEAEYFDNGGEGVAYGDSTPGNTGGALRQTGVDLEAASEGGYDVGWIAAGEWLNYSVDVASSGSYTVQVRVASPYGGRMHVGFNGSSPVWKALSVPNTGGWQRWTTVSFTATLAAGQQLLTVYFDTAGINLNRVAVVGGTASSPAPTPSPSPSGSVTEVPVVAWNIRVNDSSAAHAKAVAAALAAMNPQPRIVIMSEARKSQFNTYISELRTRTGRTWNGTFQTHCPPGAWNGSSCTSSEDEGVGVFTSFPIRNSSSLYLPYADQYHSARVAVRAAVDVNGAVLQVFGVHLIPDSAAGRSGSMAKLKTWASGYSKPQVVGGDFNGGPTEINSSGGMGGVFLDATQAVGSGSPFTAFQPKPSVKLDYLFSDTGGKAQPQWSHVDTGTGTVSDHAPVVASYRVSP